MLVAVVVVSADIAAAIEVEAVVRLATVASDPAVRVASVRLRVAYDQMEASVSPPLPTVETATSRLSTKCLPTVPAPVRVEVATFQTSAARVPNEVRVRVVLAQTATGMVATSDEEAVRTVAVVFALIAV
jgi:hypothetical protein